MAQATGAHSYYDEPIATGGNREDLGDMVWDVSPADTPLITAIKKVKATGVLHSWLTDSLSTGAGTSRIEGDDATAADPTSRVRLTNNTEIFTKHSVVTGTQEASLKGGGIKSEMAYQLPRRVRELKTHIEHAAIGIDHVQPPKGIVG